LSLCDAVGLLDRVIEGPIASAKGRLPRGAVSINRSYGVALPLVVGARSDAGLEIGDGGVAVAPSQNRVP
jgi:hypothetical protein